MPPFRRKQCQTPLTYAIFPISTMIPCACWKEGWHALAM